MTDAARPVHSFAITRGKECTQLALFKRIDLSEITQVALVLVVDKEADPKHLGEQICAGLDHELMTRGRAEGQC